MVFNATVNNISAISWRSVLLVEETGVPGENRRAVKLMQRLSTFVRGNNSSGLMNIYKQLRALFACVVCSSLP
jgi:hypothetical protein